VENPLYASLDSKKADSLLQKEISSRITYDQKEEYESLMNLVYDYINSISYDYPIPVTFNDDLPLQTLLKTMGLTPELTEVTDINKLIQNIKVLSYLLKKDIFVFFNLKDFFSEDEILIFLKSMTQLEVKILIISSHSSPKLQDERQIIIDKDLCELHIC
jgi:CRISPR type II-A-associated protein Csn2